MLPLRLTMAIPKLASTQRLYDSLCILGNCKVVYADHAASSVSLLLHAVTCCNLQATAGGVSPSEGALADMLWFLLLFNPMKGVLANLRWTSACYVTTALSCRNHLQRPIFHMQHLLLCLKQQTTQQPRVINNIIYTEI